MEKNVKLMEKKFFATKQNSQSVLCKFLNKRLLYMTQAKEWPYYSKKNEQIHIMTLSYYWNKSIFSKADCVRSNTKNIHKILEKTAECEPCEFAKVNKIAFI